MKSKSRQQTSLQWSSEGQGKQPVRPLLVVLKGAFWKASLIWITTPTTATKHSIILVLSHVNFVVITGVWHLVFMDPPNRSLRNCSLASICLQFPAQVTSFNEIILFQNYLHNFYKCFYYSTIFTLSTPLTLRLLVLLQSIF